MRDLCLLLLISFGLAQSIAAAQKPNFVVIFTDDQGYGDLSCFGGDHISTPRIDRMAAEGSRADQLLRGCLSLYSIARRSDDRVLSHAY